MRALAATLSYIAAVVCALSFFLYAVTRRLRPEESSARGATALVIVAGALLVFVIMGGFAWFLFLGVAD